MNKSHNGFIRHNRRLVETGRCHARGLSTITYVGCSFTHRWTVSIMLFSHTSKLQKRHYLIVQVQVVKLSIGPEVLGVMVQSEVHIPSVPLYDYRVPVVVIQQAPTGHRGVTLNGTVLVAAWRELCKAHGREQVINICQHQTIKSLRCQRNATGFLCP